ncbi:MAG: YlmH/Sll1252 family protein [Clostridiales bacterium]|nr:YlmH/Sll1252 family protein [Clostridiales bacterium]
MITGEERIQDLARRCARTGNTLYTRFLDPVQADFARRCAREAGINCTLFGGYPQAERAVAAFSEDGEAGDFPVSCLDVEWNARYAQIGHRDLLGAVMGLGVDRDTTGDIVLAGEGLAYLFCLAGMEEAVTTELDSAGRAKLRLSRHEGEVVCPEPEGQRRRITLASQRLDAFVSAGYDLSRSEAQKRINAGLVKLNHLPNQRTDAHVEAGDLISVRGSGRMKVEEILGQTRRGRLAAQIFQYGGSK